MECSWLDNGDKRMNWNIMDLKVGDYIKCKREYWIMFIPYNKNIH